MKICNYEMLNFSTDNLILSEKGISKINSPQLWEALEEIKAITDTPLEADQLNSVLLKYDLNIDSTTDFLSRIIKIESNTKKHYYTKIIIAHDSKDKANFLMALQDNTSENIELLSLKELSSKNISNYPATFVHIHTTHYNHEDLKLLYFKIADCSPQHAISVSHFVEDTFNVSQPFLPEIGNPCFFCIMDRAISYEQFNPSNNHWAKLINLCARHKTTTPEKSRTQFQTNLAIGFLCQRIKLFAADLSAQRHQDCVLASASINLNTGKINEDMPSHWFQCRCLRGNA